MRDSQIYPLAGGASTEFLLSHSHSKLEAGFFLSYRPRGTGPEKSLAQHLAVGPGSLLDVRASILKPIPCGGLTCSVLMQERGCWPASV